MWSVGVVLATDWFRLFSCVLVASKWDDKCVTGWQGYKASCKACWSSKVGCLLQVSHSHGFKLQLQSQIAIINTAYSFNFKCGW
jgi:hypothetical protein